MVFDTGYAGQDVLRAVLTGQSQAYTSLTALQIRLDTNPLLEQLKVYLSGREVVFQKDSSGNDVLVEVKVGEQKCNASGVQSIMQTITLLFNSQVVQGNFSEDRYEAFIEEAHKSLLDAIFENRYQWGIKICDLNHILDTIMLALLPFASRTINNEERKSYESTVRTVESTNIQERTGGGFSLFSNKSNK